MTGIQPGGPPGAAEGASGADEGPLLRPALSLREGRVFVVVRDQPVAPGVVVRALDLEVPDVAFPVDLRGGVGRFQHHATRLISAAIEIDLATAAAAITRRLPPEGPVRALSLRAEAGVVVAEARLSGPRGVRGRELARHVILPAHGRMLRALAVEQVRLGGVQTAVDAVAHAVQAVLATAPGGRALVPTVDAEGALVLDGLAAVLRAAMLPAGWKLPAHEGVGPARAYLSREGGLWVVFGAEPLERPLPAEDPEGARAALRAQAREDVRGLADAPGAGVEARFGALRAALDERLGPPELLERALVLGASEPSLHVDAADLVADALVLAPGSAIARAVRAELAEARGEHEAAVEDWSRAAEAFAREGRTRLAGLAHLAAAERQRGEVRAASLEAALAALGDDPEVLRVLVEDLVAARQPAAVSAARRLARAATAPVERAWAHVAAGDVLRSVMHEPIAAKREYERALLVEPEDGAALEGLAAALTEQGDPRRAAAILERLFSRAMSAQDKARAATLSVALGDLWRPLDWAAAVARWRRASELDPSSAPAIERLARAAAEAPEDVLALEAGERALALARRAGARLPIEIERELRLRAGRVALRSPGRQAEALAHAEVILTHAPADAEALAVARRSAQALGRSDVLARWLAAAADEHLVRGEVAEASQLIREEAALRSVGWAEDVDAFDHRGARGVEEPARADGTGGPYSAIDLATELGPSADRAPPPVDRSGSPARPLVDLLPGGSSRAGADDVARLAAELRPSWSPPAATEWDPPRSATSTPASRSAAARRSSWPAPAASPPDPARSARALGPARPDLAPPDPASPGPVSPGPRSSGTGRPLASSPPGTSTDEARAPALQTEQSSREGSRSPASPLEASPLAADHRRAREPGSAARRRSPDHPDHPDLRLRSDARAALVRRAEAVLAARPGDAAALDVLAAHDDRPGARMRALQARLDAATDRAERGALTLALSQAQAAGGDAHAALALAATAVTAPLSAASWVAWARALAESEAAAQVPRLLALAAAHASPAEARTLVHAEAVARERVGDRVGAYEALARGATTPDELAEVTRLALLLERPAEARAWLARWALVADADPADRARWLTASADAARASADADAEIAALESLLDLFAAERFPGLTGVGAHRQAIAARLASTLAASGRIRDLARLERRRSNAPGTPVAEAITSALAAAQAWATAGDAEEAVQDLERVLAWGAALPLAAPQVAHALDVLERLARHSGDAAQVVAALDRRARFVHGAEARARVRLEQAQVLQDAGSPAEAIARLQQARAELPRSRAIAGRLAHESKRLGLLELWATAEAHLAALADDEGDRAAAVEQHAVAAAALAEVGRLADAVVHDRVVVERGAGEVPVARVERSLRRLERHARAAADHALLDEVLERWAEIEPPVAAVERLFEKAELELARHGPNDRALAALRRARARAEDDVPRARELDARIGEVLTALERWDELAAHAVARGDRAVGGRRATAYLEAARVLDERLGQTASALERTRAALEAEPGNLAGRTLRRRLLRETARGTELAEALLEDARAAAPGEEQASLQLEAADLLAPLGDDAVPSTAAVLRALDIGRDVARGAPRWAAPHRRVAHYARLLARFDEEYLALGRLAEVTDDPVERALAVWRRVELARGPIEDPIGAQAELYDVIQTVEGLDDEQGARLVELLARTPSIVRPEGVAAPLDALLALGTALTAETRDFETHLRYLLRQLERAPDARTRADIHFRIGETREWKMGDGDAAERAYLAALRELPEHERSRRSLRGLYLAVDRFGDLAEHLGIEELLSLWVELGKSFAGERQIAAGEALWPRLPRGSAERARVLLATADLYRTARDEAEGAVMLLELVTREGPQEFEPAALERLRVLFLEEGRNDLYVEILRRQADRAEGDVARARALAEVGEALEWKLGDGAGAELEYRTALAADPSCALARERMGLLLASQDRYAELAADLGLDTLEKEALALASRGRREGARLVRAADVLAGLLPEPRRAELWGELIEREPDPELRRKLMTYGPVSSLGQPSVAPPAWDEPPSATHFELPAVSEGVELEPEGRRSRAPVRLTIITADPLADVVRLVPRVSEPGAVQPDQPAQVLPINREEDGGEARASSAPLAPVPSTPPAAEGAATRIVDSEEAWEEVMARVPLDDGSGVDVDLSTGAMEVPSAIEEAEPIEPPAREAAAEQPPEPLPAPRLAVTLRDVTLPRGGEDMTWASWGPAEASRVMPGERGREEQRGREDEAAPGPREARPLDLEAAAPGPGGADADPSLIERAHDAARPPLRDSDAALAVEATSAVPDGAGSHADPGAPRAPSEAPRPLEVPTLAEGTGAPPRASLPTRWSTLAIRARTGDRRALALLRRGAARWPLRVDALLALDTVAARALAHALDPRAVPAALRPLSVTPHGPAAWRRLVPDALDTPLAALLARTAMPLAAVLPPPATDLAARHPLVDGGRTLPALARALDLSLSAERDDGLRGVRAEPGEPPALILGGDIGDDAHGTFRVAAAAMQVRLGGLLVDAPDLHAWLRTLVHLTDTRDDEDPAAELLRARLGPSGLADVEGLGERLRPAVDGETWAAWLLRVHHAAATFAALWTGSAAPLLEEAGPEADRRALIEHWLSEPVDRWIMSLRSES